MERFPVEDKIRLKTNLNTGSAAEGQSSVLHRVTVNVVPITKFKWLQWKEVKKGQKGLIFKLWRFAPLPGLLPQQQSWDARHDAAQQHVKDTRLQDIIFKIFWIYRISRNSKRTRWIPCQDHWQWCKWGMGCRNWHSSLNKNPFVSQSKTKQEYFGLFPWYIFLSQSFPLKKKIIIVTHIFRSHRSSCKDLASNLQLQPL